MSIKSLETMEIDAVHEEDRRSAQRINGHWLEVFDNILTHSYSYRFNRTNISRDDAELIIAGATAANERAQS